MNPDSNTDSQTNITTKSDYYKKWYSENKDAKLAYQKEKVKCEICNVMISRGNMIDHNKSLTHLQNLDLNKKTELYNKINRLEGELSSTIKEIKDYLHKE